MIFPTNYCWEHKVVSLTLWVISISTWQTTYVSSCLTTAPVKHFNMTDYLCQQLFDDCTCQTFQHDRLLMSAAVWRLHLSNISTWQITYVSSCLTTAPVKHFNMTDYLCQQLFDDCTCQTFQHDRLLMSAAVWRLHLSNISTWQTTYVSSCLTTAPVKHFNMTDYLCQQLFDDCTCQTFQHDRLLMSAAVWRLHLSNIPTWQTTYVSSCLTTAPVKHSNMTDYLCQQLFDDCTCQTFQHDRLFMSAAVWRLHLSNIPTWQTTYVSSCLTTAPVKHFNMTDYLCQQLFDDCTCQTFQHDRLLMSAAVWRLHPSNIPTWQTTYVSSCLTTAPVKHFNMTDYLCQQLFDDCTCLTSGHLSITGSSTHYVHTSVSLKGNTGVLRVTQRWVCRLSTGYIVISYLVMCCNLFSDVL